MNMKITNTLKKFPLWLKIIFGIASSIIILFIAVVVYVVIVLITWRFDSEDLEKNLSTKFHQEIAKIPEMQPVNFHSSGKYSGQADVRVDIKDKGQVWFDYDEKGMGSIYEIGKYDTLWNCFSNKPDEKREIYNGSEPLYLGKKSHFRKWFPFEVNNLQDLVNKHDAIVAVLDTFPVREPVPGRGSTQNPDPNYILYTQRRTEVGSGESTCDLFISK